MELINEFPLSKLPLKIDFERTPNIIDITKYNIIIVGSLIKEIGLLTQCNQIISVIVCNYFRLRIWCCLRLSAIIFHSLMMWPMICYYLLLSARTSYALPLWSVGIY